MQKIWNIKPRTKQNIIEQILENRGIGAGETRREFLNPDYAGLHDPFLFADMRKAVDRIWQALVAGEKILIYGDYDADGVTASAVLYRTLQALGAAPLMHIPDRYTEGYGLNLDNLPKIQERGATLVITVDCGTNSAAEATWCKEHGIDLIVTDHHEVTQENPDAFALINPKAGPKVPGSSYPYHELVGVGVAFKLACAILATRKEPRELPAEQAAIVAALPDGYEKWLLDLVAIGTVADCHSLLGENRILVKYGLQVMAKSKWAGLRALLDVTGYAAGANGAAAKTLDTYTIGFVLAPRINAAGRIEHASAAFDLLICDDPAEARRLADALQALDVKRQMITETVMSEARTQLAAMEDRKILLAVGSDWPRGVVGLVAGKLVEEFAKPVLVLERGELEAVGSARSTASFNIVEALTYAKDSLVKYGGHAGAAGFTVRSELIDVFYKHLLDFAEKNMAEAPTGRVLEIEAELTPDEASLQTAEDLNAFEPFGVDNHRPKFVLRGAVLREYNLVGKEQKHVQLTVVVGENDWARGKNPRYLRCIAFNYAKTIGAFNPGERVDLAFELVAETWNGSKNLKLKIADIKKSE